MSPLFRNTPAEGNAPDRLPSNPATQRIGGMTGGFRNRLQSATSPAAEAPQITPENAQELMRTIAGKTIALGKGYTLKFDTKDLETQFGTLGADNALRFGRVTLSVVDERGNTVSSKATPLQGALQWNAVATEKAGAYSDWDSLIGSAATATKNEQRSTFMSDVNPKAPTAGDEALAKIAQRFQLAI